MQVEKKKKKRQEEKKKRSTGTARRTSACLLPRVTHTLLLHPTAKKAKEKSFQHILLTPHQPAEGLISTEVNCSSDCPTRDFVLMLTLRLFPLSFCSLSPHCSLSPTFIPSSPCLFCPSPSLFSTFSKTLHHFCSAPVLPNSREGIMQ